MRYVGSWLYCGCSMWLMFAPKSILFNLWIEGHHCVCCLMIFDSLSGFTAALHHVSILPRRNISIHVKKIFVWRRLNQQLLVCWSAFPLFPRALLLITIPTQPYPHSLLQRRRIPKLLPPRSSSAEMWVPMEFAQSTASARSSVPLACLRRLKVRYTLFPYTV